MVGKYITVIFRKTEFCHTELPASGGFVEVSQIETLRQAQGDKITHILLNGYFLD